MLKQKATLNNAQPAATPATEQATASNTAPNGARPAIQ